MTDPVMTWIRVAGVGAATGMRVAMPLATESWAATTGRLQTDTGLLAYLANRNVARFLAVMACGEVLVDKSSRTPSRTAFGAFEGRLALGALAGAILAGTHRRPHAWGAAIGATSAGASAILALRGRLSLDGAGLPDPLVAIVEDLFVFFLSRWAVAGSEIPRP